MKPFKTLNKLATATCLAALVFPILITSASAQVFTDRATFLSALGPYSVESFETTPLIGTTGGGSVLSISLPAFTVSSTPKAVKVLGTDDGFGSHNTTPSGSRFLYLDTDIGLQGTVTTFQFNSPLSAFGFDYTGVTEQGTTFTALLAGQTFDLMVNSGPTDSRFWGFIGATPFSSLDVNSGSDSGYGIDQVTFALVPEPSSLCLLALGLCCPVFVPRMKQREA